MKRNFLLASFFVLLSLGAAFAQLLPPSPVTAINTLGGGIKIDWTYGATNPIGGFKIRVTEAGIADNVTLIPVAGSLRTYTLFQGDTDHPLTPGVNYSFEVLAQAAAIPNVLNDSPFSTPTPNLAYIGGLVSTPDLIAHNNTLTFHSVQLQWQDYNGTNEDGYEIVINSSPNTITVVAPPGHTNYTWTVTGLSPKTFYTFKVRAFKLVNNVRVYSTDSNPASVTTKVAPAAAPSIFFTNNCPTLVGVNWTVDRPEDIDTYIILRSFGGGFDVVGIKTKFESVYYDLDAQPGKTAIYRVVAINESSPNGVPSVDRSIYTTPYSAPPAPENVISDKALKSNSFLTIKWGNPGYDSGCKSNVRSSNYIMYKLSTETEYKQYAIVEAEANTVVIEGLKPKDIVDFRVFSLSDQGLASEWVGGRDTTLGPPYAPSGLVASSGVDALDNTITTLKWTDNAGDEDGFTVEGSSDNTTFVELGRRGYNLGFSPVEYVHLPVEEGVTYYYRVQAYSNSQGTSDYTPSIIHTVGYSSAPKAPYNFRATANSGKVVLTWLDDSAREENFVVEKSSDNGTTYAVIATLGRNAVTFTDENTAAGASYKYRVKAVNPKGSSAYATADYGPASSAVSALNSDAVSVYPNPTVDFVNIRIPAELVGKSGSIVVTDKNSRVILDKTFRFDSEELNLDFNKFGEGMYNVTISTGGSKISKKVYKF